MARTAAVHRLQASLAETRRALRWLAGGYRAHNAIQACRCAACVHARLMLNEADLALLAPPPGKASPGSSHPGGGADGRAVRAARVLVERLACELATRLPEGDEYLAGVRAAAKHIGFLEREPSLVPFLLDDAGEAEAVPA